MIRTLDKGHTQLANSQESIFFNKKNEAIVTAKRDGDLFKMVFREKKSDSIIIYIIIYNNFEQSKSENCIISTSIKIWHERLAHQNVTRQRNIETK